MTRVTPIDNIDVMGPFDQLPHRVVGSYIESKQQNKLLVKPPNLGSTGDGIEFLLVHNDLELKDMRKDQLELQDNAERQGLINKRRIEEIREMQDNLRKRFMVANSFLKDCDDKRRAAIDVVQLEKERHQNLKEEIKTGKANVETLKKFKSDLSATVAELEPYERVINEVVALSDVWKTSKDCRDSCDALMLTQVEILETKRQKFMEIEYLRQRMIKLATDAAATLLGLNNELAELERTYAIACGICLYWEKMISDVKAAVNANNLLIARMEDEIVLMYNMVCRRRGIEKKLQNDEVEKMLNVIRDEYNLLQEVWRQCRELLPRAPLNSRKKVSYHKIK